MGLCYFGPFVTCSIKCERINNVPHRVNEPMAKWKENCKNGPMILTTAKNSHFLLTNRSIVLFFTVWLIIIYDILFSSNFYILSNTPKPFQQH